MHESNIVIIFLTELLIIIKICFWLCFEFHSNAVFLVFAINKKLKDRYVARISFQKWLRQKSTLEAYFFILIALGTSRSYTALETGMNNQLHINSLTIHLPCHVVPIWRHQKLIHVLFFAVSSWKWWNMQEINNSSSQLRH